MARAGRDLRQAAADVQRLAENIEHFVNINIRQVMDRVSSATRQNVARGPSPYQQIVTGTLRQSVETRRASELSLDDVELGDDTYASWATHIGAPHAAYVEYGTGARQSGSPNGQRFRAPSVPPTMSILRWVRLKGVQPRSPVYINDDGTTDELGLAHAIAQSIAQHGSHAHPYARPAWHENREDIKRSHKQGVKRALRATF